MFYKTEPKRNECHEIFCVTDSDAQRIVQRHCSRLSESFRLSFLVIARYGGVPFGRARFRRGQSHFDFAFSRVTCKENYHFKVQRSLYVSPSGHYMYRPVITICTASGHYMYRQFNTQQFSVLPTHCIYVFCVDLRTNSHYFPIQH